jgi:DNA-binding MarR family transcriptional regulator
VSKARCDSDKRVFWVSLTPDGRAAAAAAAPQHVDDVRELFIGLATPDQLSAITRLAITVSEKLAEQ